eukprot:7391988-Prymnesium_polylepis.4
MGLDGAVLTLPDRRYTWARSEFGAHHLNCTMEALGEADGGEFEDDADFGGGAMEAAVVEAVQQVPVAVAVEAVAVVAAEAVGVAVQEAVAEAEPAAAVARKRRRDPEEVARAKAAKVAERAAVKAARAQATADAKAAREQAKAARAAERAEARAARALPADGVALASPVVHNRARRAAAQRANDAMAAQEETQEEATPVSAAPVALAPPANVKEATLSEALAGRFARFRAVKQPPDWLASALEPDTPTAKTLHGASIVFHWLDFGWCVARLGAASDPTANFSAVYLNGWREQHTLTLAAYSATGAHGSWALLEATRTASPIFGYEGGRYKKRIGGAAVWLRAASDGLLHHTREELEQARQAAMEAARDEREEAVEEELADGGHDVGDRVWAKGRAPGSGEMEFFEAVVLGKRKRYPPLKVRACHP